MAKPNQVESEETAGSTPASGSSDRHGVTYTMGVSVLRMSLLPKAPPPRRRTLSEVWSSLWETDPPVFPVRLGAGTSWPKVKRIGPAFLTSILFHSSTVFFLYSIPFAAILALFLGAPRARRSSHPQMVVYEFHHLTLPEYLPILHPPEVAAAPEPVAKHAARQRPGITHFDPRITIVSNPPKPDNFRLTLKTEDAPPGIKPPKDAAIPDLVTGGPTPPPEKVNHPAPETPSAPPKPVQTPTVPALATLAAQPAPPPPTLALPKPSPEITAAHLEVSPPPPPVVKTPPPAQATAPPPPKEATPPAPAPPSTQAPAKKSESAAPSDAQKAAGGPQITALSVNPIPLKELSAIPAGERAGAFSISPAGTADGSKVGAPATPRDVGDKGGPGHEKNVAVGKAAANPGGAHSSAASPTLSISGPAGAAGISAGTLSPLKAGDLVYKVTPETPKAHAPSLVVSSGASGGGGLRIFGVLHGDKIYTVYFSMPGKNWILQYCVRGSAPQMDPATRVVQLRIQPPLTPPAAIEQFDFHRPAPAPDPANSMIVLHGTIGEDGSVSDLVVVQGLDAISNEAAQAAFLRWKFKPALRDGTPVALDVLLGIP